MYAVCMIGVLLEHPIFKLYYDMVTEGMVILANYFLDNISVAQTYGNVYILYRNCYATCTHLFQFSICCNFFICHDFNIDVHFCSHIWELCKCIKCS